MKPTRILLVDDHELVRAGLRSLLESFQGLEVVAEANDGQEALRQIAAYRPDIALMDISMDGMAGLEATAQAAREFPGTRIIILSMHANEVYVLQALRAGAAGYLRKDARAQELEAAIRSVMKGEVFLTPSVSRFVLAGYVRRTGTAGPGAVQLTPRQREILQLVAQGRTTAEIARTLVLSTKTVETHRAKIMERLGIHDLAGLVRYAIREGLVLPEE